jgi:hypothetical protein
MLSGTLSNVYVQNLCRARGLEKQRRDPVSTWTNQGRADKKYTKKV